MAFTPDFLHRVKACGVRALAERFTKLTKTENDSYSGCCPNPEHEDHKASFYIRKSEKTGIETWCCFSCHCGQKHNDNFGTDNIAFVQWMYYHTYHKLLSFPEAVERTAKFYGIPVDTDKFAPIYRNNRMLMERYEKELSPFVRNYLYLRGLDDTDIKKWHIGFYNGRITFPIMNHSGDVIGFSNRAFSQREIASGRKYINTANSEVFQKNAAMFGVQFLDLSKRHIFITEGQFDAILGSKYGIPNIIAVMTCHLTDNQVKFIKSHQLTPILCFDNDKAGREGMIDSLAHLFAAGVKNSKAVFLPDSRDLADLGRDYKEQLIDFLRGHIMSYSQYILKGIADDIDASIMSKQQEAMPRIRSVLDSIQDPDEKLVARDFIRKRIHLWNA